MIEIVRERRIDAAPHQVWTLVDDVTRLPEWFVVAERGELLEGVGVGRRQRLHGQWGKRRFEVDQVVVEHEPGRLLAWRHEAERLDGSPAPRFATETRFSVRLESEDGATRVRLESRQQPASAVKGLVMRAGARRFARQLERSLERLQAIVTK